MTSPTSDPTARYDTAVERESAAWQALQHHEPASPGRAEAWLAWSQAISQTNAAWRELNRKGPHLTQPTGDTSA